LDGARPHEPPTGEIAPTNYSAAEGLPAIGEMEWDEGVERYLQAQSIMELGWWEQGRIAASVAKSYGDDSIGEFAREVDASAQTVRFQRAIYRRWKQLEQNAPIGAFWEEVKAGRVRFHNLKLLQPLSDDDYLEVLGLALDNDWKHGRIARGGRHPARADRAGPGGGRWARGG
jgi:hypothetical protein